MRTLTAVVRRSPEACWRVLIDPATFTGWVPGLRRARVITTDTSGRPRDVQFDFGASRTYSLVYSYTDDDREVRWEPGLGKRDAVRGFARIEPTDGGTTLIYGLEPGDARTEIELDDLGALVAAFVRWMHEAR
ncbi:MAG: SRPBCC family protein [Kofleriaceae bacterium]